MSETIRRTCADLRLPLIQDPTKLTGNGCPEEKHEEDHHDDEDASAEGSSESAESATPAEPSTTPDDTAGNRRLGAAAAGVLGAIFGRLF